MAPSVSPSDSKHTWSRNRDHETSLKKDLWTHTTPWGLRPKNHVHKAHTKLSTIKVAGRKSLALTSAELSYAVAFFKALADKHHLWDLDAALKTVPPPGRGDAMTWNRLPRCRSALKRWKKKANKHKANSSLPTPP